MNNIFKIINNLAMEDLKNILDEFFNYLNIDFSDLTLEKPGENIYLVKIQTKDSGILIGPHGRNLDSVQSILRLMLSKKLESKIKLHLEVNDYLKSKDERLIGFIKSKIVELENNGKDIILPYYSAYDRKKIHSYIAELENNSISTKSMGEGKDRRIHLCKTGSTLSLDIDGEDI